MESPPNLVSNGKRLDDIMYQRMKNRERQRRYRERKRLQAETINKASGEKMPPKFVTESSPIGESNFRITRVHCARKWKKDARLAHAVKQEVSADVIPCYAISPAGEDEASYLSFGTKAEHGVEGEVPSIPTSGGDTPGNDQVKPERRNWKAEARNKKQ